MPRKAVSSQPPTGSADQGITVDLSWTAGPDTNSFNLYFGDSEPPAFLGNQTDTFYNLETLAPSTTYCWRVDSVNGIGTTAGDGWSFTTRAGTAPSKASAPIPADAATGCALTTDVLWTKGADTDISRIYFGIMKPPPLVGATTGVWWDPGLLLANTTYYWRVGQINEFGEREGDVWSFATTGLVAKRRTSSAR